MYFRDEQSSVNDVHSDLLSLQPWKIFIHKQCLLSIRQGTRKLEGNLTYYIVK